MKELDLETLETRDPVASAFFKDIQRSQIEMTDEQEQECLQSYKITRDYMHVKIAFDEKCASRFLVHYADLLAEGRSIAKLSADFNSKKKGHNKKITDRFKERLHNVCTDELPRAILDLNLSDDCYDLMLKSGSSETKSEVLVHQKYLYEIEKQMMYTMLQACVAIGKKYASAIFGIDEMDAIQEANLGVQEAVRKYNLNYRTDEGNRIKFSTYAYTLAERRVKDWIMDQSRTIKLPRSRLNQIFLVLEAFDKMEEGGIENLTNKANEILTERKGKPLTGGEEISEDKVSEIIELLQGNTITLSTPWNNKTKTLGDMIPADIVNADELIEMDQDKKKLIEVMKRVLTSVEFDVLWFRYLNPDTKEVRPSREISEYLEKKYGKSLTRERIRQIINKGLSKLRKQRRELEQLSSLLGE